MQDPECLIEDGGSFDAATGLVNSRMVLLQHPFYLRVLKTGAVCRSFTSGIVEYAVGVVIEWSSTLEDCVGVTVSCPRRRLAQELKRRNALV